MTDHVLGDAAARIRQRGAYGGEVVLTGPAAEKLAELLEEIEWQGQRDDEHPMREVVETGRQLAEAMGATS